MFYETQWKTKKKKKTGLEAMTGLGPRLANTILGKCHFI